MEEDLLVLFLGLGRSIGPPWNFFYRRPCFLLILNDVKSKMFFKSTKIPIKWFFVESKWWVLKQKPQEDRSSGYSTKNLTFFNNFI